MTLWNNYCMNFNEIITNIDEYNKILKFSINYNYNLLFYSTYGFPFDLFIDEIIRQKFNISQIYRKESWWNKSIIYNENQYFFEIDLNNPNMNKKFKDLTEMLLFIIKSKCINKQKHLIIIKNIDKLNEYFFSFRIILEHYYNNCYFICTTHQISKIENPIKSRFFMFRFRLFTNQEIQWIFKEYLKTSLNSSLIKNNCRNIIFAIFIGQIEINEPLLISDDLCNLTYPPLKDFLKSKYDLNDIRQISYKYSQYGLDIKDLVMDLMYINKYPKTLIINKGILLESLLIQSNKGREPIYLETLLTQLLI